jgi:hypothetical protein
MRPLERIWGVKAFEEKDCLMGGLSDSFAHPAALHDGGRGAAYLLEYKSVGGKPPRSFSGAAFLRCGQKNPARENVAERFYYERQF